MQRVALEKSWRHLWAVTMYNHRCLRSVVCKCTHGHAVHAWFQIQWFETSHMEKVSRGHTNCSFILNPRFPGIIARPQIQSQVIVSTKTTTKYVTDVNNRMYMVVDIRYVFSVCYVTHYDVTWIVIVARRLFMGKYVKGCDKKIISSSWSKVETFVPPEIPTNRVVWWPQLL